MSSSTSLDDVEKGLAEDVQCKSDSEIYLTGTDEYSREASEPPFGVHGDQFGSEKHGTPKLSINNMESVPNGGLIAWLQVLGSFFLFWNTWGITNAFGTYQTYYESALLASSSPSEISWIGSLQAMLMMLVGALSGPVYDAGYVRHLVTGGSVLAVLGQMMLSLCTEYWQVFLAQAVCLGIGAGMLFVPAVSILSTYFSTKIATAVGIATSGSSLGGVVYPIVFHKLQPTVGFAWSTRVIGFIMLATLAVSNCVMKVRVLPAGRRKFLDLKAFGEPAYVCFVLGMTLCFAGLYEPFFYVQSEAIDKGIMDPGLAFNLLSIINAPSTLGRILPGIVADRLGPMNVVIPCSLITGVICLCLISAASSKGGLIAALNFYGFFCGALVSMAPTVFVHLTKNRAVIGTRMGMGFAIISMGLLVGTPISGAILGLTRSYANVWIFGGVLILVGTALMSATRVLEGGWSLARKV